LSFPRTTIGSTFVGMPSTFMVLYVPLPLL